MRDAGHPVKLGLEMDFVPGREEQLAALLEGRPWDYVIGSVHFIADRAVDHEGYDAWRTRRPGRGLARRTSRPSATPPRAACSTCSPIPTS